MELISYLLRYGECVRTERSKMKMSQVEFYNYLFPGNTKEEENIKKKMNMIENGKQKSLDLEFLLALCHKCSVSADYILGIDKDYSNHEIEFVCNYTGLEENAVKHLHRWCVGKNNGADPSKIDEVYIGDEGEQEYWRRYEKQIGIQFLRIINYLFKEGKRKKTKGDLHKGKYSNLTILHSLYLLCMSKPERVFGHLVATEDDYTLWNLINRSPHASYCIYLDPQKPIHLQDDSKVWYPFQAKEILEQIARNRLNKDLDWLIEQVKMDEKKEGMN